MSGKTRIEHVSCDSTGRTPNTGRVPELDLDFALLDVDSHARSPSTYVFSTVANPYTQYSWRKMADDMKEHVDRLLTY